MRNQSTFGSWPASFLVAGFFLLVMWIFFWAQHLFDFDFYTLGILPRTRGGLIGVLTMPFIHSQREMEHIVNNSLPTVLLISALFYYYKPIAWKVLLIGWVLTGLGVWSYAENTGSYHIGMSGIIYFLAAFLFTSGVYRNYLPLQALSLFIIFLYGSMVWGIFPMKEQISWEGHFAGMAIGLVLAHLYRKQGPQRPKFQYEIEKEMGIDPPDLEALYNERMKLLEEERHAEPDEVTPRIVYHYKTNEQKNDKSE